MLRCIVGCVSCINCAYLLASDTLIRTRTGRVPTEPDDLNRFVAAYDRYIASLREGKVDLRAWEKVREAWEHMTK